VAGQLLVGFHRGESDAAMDAIIRRHGASVLKRFPQIGVALVGLPPGVSTDAAAASYQGERGVLFAQPNFRIHADDVTPNDPGFPDQWGLSNTAQQEPPGTGAIGTRGDDISAPRAWAIQTGSSNVTVAVIDTGVDTGHPDLVGNLDLADARNFTDNTSVVYNPSQSCGNGEVNDDHGTHVAGILGAVGNNRSGVTGVAWRVRILPLKILHAARAPTPTPSPRSSTPSRRAPRSSTSRGAGSRPPARPSARR
jgi:subtilisin family serine protease